MVTPHTPDHDKAGANTAEDSEAKARAAAAQGAERDPPAADEHGGPPGPEPTRYGDWERAGRCIDF